MVQKENLVIGGAMTDPKGDRSKGPAEQDDPDLFTRIVKTDENGVMFQVQRHTKLVVSTLIDYLNANN